MNKTRPAWILLALVTASGLLGGCSVAAPSSASLVPSVVTLPGPSTTVVTSPSPSPSEATTPEPAASDSSDEPGPEVTADHTIEPPPDATLQVEGGDPVIGQLGSFGWNGAASDAPYLPGFPIHVGNGERLTFRMLSPVTIGQWQVSRVPPSSVPGGVDGLVGMGEGTGNAISFAAPPKGTWAVSVSVWFAEPLGSAVYYWKVIVD
jgi:hypothetical protein